MLFFQNLENTLLICIFLNWKVLQIDDTIFLTKKPYNDQEWTKLISEAKIAWHLNNFDLTEILKVFFIYQASIKIPYISYIASIISGKQVIGKTMSGILLIF